MAVSKKHPVSRAGLRRFDALLASYKRTPRISVLAEFIKTEMPELRVSVEQGYCNTDRKPAGFRFITSPGKGRKGNRLKVQNKDGTFLLDHNSAETYRSNDEIVRWIRYRLEGNPWAWKSWGVPTTPRKKT